MKKTKTIILLLVSIHSFGQNLEECGIDNNPELTQMESEYLNSYLTENRNGFDFKNKKVLFITGPSGFKVGTKKEYFDDIKKWNKKGGKIATWIVELNEKEQVESSYDVMVTYWVKVFTKRQKRKILNQIKARR